MISEAFTVNSRSARISSLVLVTLTLLMAVGISPLHVTRATNLDPPTVGVWSNDCGSFNISITSCPSGFLNVGNTITVQVNVTNAAVGSVNGYEFFLYYDPAFLSASFDSTTGTTGTVFVGQFVTTQDVTPAGTVHMSGVCYGGPGSGACYNTMTSGPLVNINFKILAVGVSPLTLAVGLVPSGFAQSFTELTTPSALAPSTADGYFKNDPAKLGPVASFSWSPASPKPQGQVTFFANASYDPDATGSVYPNGIRLYIWDFGGASSQSQAFASSAYSFKLGAVFGNFSIRLTVVDGDNTTDYNQFEGMKTELFTVVQNPFHDLIAQTLSLKPNPANVGDKVTVNTDVFNNGTFPEAFNLTLSYGTPATIFGTVSNQSITIGTTSSFSITLDTSGFTPGGFYTLTATVTVLPSLNNTKGIDNLPRNNLKTTVLNMQGAPTSSSNLLLIAGVAVGVVAVLAAVTVLLRRRRRASASD